MFPEQLKKILNLIKKTGDRVIIYDASVPDESFVVMDIDRYSEIIFPKMPVDKVPEIRQTIEVKGDETPINKAINVETENLTEEDLTDKINREISVWKNRENIPFVAEEDKPKKAWTIPSNVKDKAQGVE